MKQDEAMRCQELKPDYMLYAIGAMEEPERSEIRTHLESGCETCTSGLQEARALAYSMGALLDGPEPPRELRSRVLAISGAADRRAPAVPMPAPTRSFWARPIAAWQGLALAGACLALALVPAFLWRRAIGDIEARQASTNAALANERRSEAELRGQLAKLEAAPSLRADPIIALELERGVPAGAVKQVSIPIGAAAMVLALPSDLVRQASEAELLDSSGQIIRSVSPLPAADSEATGLTIDARLLPAGRYLLALRADERTIARFPFLVERR
jgi:hypothetical protein